MTTTTKRTTVPSLRIARTFPASRERVFRAWTTPAEMARWAAPGDMTCAAEVDLRVGGHYRIVMSGPAGEPIAVGGVYRVVDPPKRLVYSWKWETGPDAVDTLITVEFNERGGSTEVVLVHEGFANDEERGKHEHGWTACLEKFAKLF